MQLPESGTPSGSFVKLEQGRGYGKIHVRGNDSGFYLAINTAANPSLSPAELEAVFIDPNNWTWNDGSTGVPMPTPILSETTEHDLRECWLVPQSDPNTGWTVIYDADFGSDGGKALGYATTPDMPLPVGGITVPLVQDKGELMSPWASRAALGLLVTALLVIINNW